MHLKIPYVKKVKWSRYRSGVAQRVGRGIALLFHYRGTRRGWVVSSTPRPHFTHGKDSVPILQEAGWAPGPVWTGGKSRPHRDIFSMPPAGFFFDSFILLCLTWVLHKCELSTMCTGGSLLLDDPQWNSFASPWVLWELGRGLCPPSMMRGTVGWTTGWGMIITFIWYWGSYPLFFVSRFSCCRCRTVQLVVSRYTDWATGPTMIPYIFI